MLSKILGENKICAKSLNYFEFKLTNFSKTKTFFIDKYQITKNNTKDFLHPGTLQEARQRLDGVFIS